MTIQQPVDGLQRLDIKMNQSNLLRQVLSPSLNLNLDLDLNLHPNLRLSRPLVIESRIKPSAWSSRI